MSDTTSPTTDGNKWPPYAKSVIENYKQNMGATPADIVESMEKWHQKEKQRVHERIEAIGGTPTPELREKQIILGMLEPDPRNRLSSKEAFDAFNDLYFLI